jgi:hypothetical protein
MLQAVSEQLTVRDVAQRCGVTTHTVKKWAATHGIRFRQRRVLPVSDEVFTRIVREAASVAAVIRGLGQAYAGAHYRNVHQEVQRLGLDTSHWTGQAHGLSVQTRLLSAQVLVENSDTSTGRVKKIILREGLLPFRCALCKMDPVWRGQPLMLRLDHANGIRNDHRLDNLRFVCPNCDSQTDTFCGRNKRH